MAYLVIVQNKVERSRDRFERTEGTHGVSHPMNPFDRGRRSRLAVLSLLIRGGARFEGPIETNNFRFMTRKDGGVCVMRKNDQRQRREQLHLHVL